MHTYEKETDEVLVRLYEEGNDSAFDVLLARHQQKLYTYILSLVRDEDKANDLFQEVFIKAITRIRSHKYVESGRFLQWLMRIAHNMIIDHFRHEQVYNFVSADESNAVVNSMSLSDASVERHIMNEQTMCNLEKLIDRLPEPQQLVVRMRIYEDLSFKDIASMTNCSINTALGRMHYAVNNLRRMAAKSDLTLIED